jgi:2-keto-4-pentenoate hydratase/2-oxohepta-3-ene-1,7-dioic acid hydratase in catechol pathway
LKIVRFVQGEASGYGLVEGNLIYTLEGDPYSDFGPGMRVGRLGRVSLGPPCQPTKIVALGLNYADHAAEAGLPLPEEPIIFLKPLTAVIGHLDQIIYPFISQRVDYEAELAVVIGRRAKNVPSHEARRYILGYTCSNDVTARDLQQKDSQWTRSKSFDTFCPLGPWIVTDLNPSRLAITCRVNGKVRQAGNTADMVFKVWDLVSFISQVMTLEPGDVIMTGTPAGVGPLSPGDVVEVEIEGIGILENEVVSQSAGELSGSPLVR